MVAAPPGPEALIPRAPLARAPVRAAIGLGANLGDPVAAVKAALAALAALADSRMAGYSSLYRSKPVGPADQPDYVNAVALLDTCLGPLALLAALQDIELAHGRVRGPWRWGPRTLDLDLLLYGEEVVALPTLTIPHPELGHRPFVVLPLYEVAPETRIPGLPPLRALAARLADPTLIRITEAPSA